jgi:hypothetical protein
MALTSGFSQQMLQFLYSSPGGAKVLRCTYLGVVVEGGRCHCARALTMPWPEPPC